MTKSKFKVGGSQRRLVRQMTPDLSFTQDFTVGSGWAEKFVFPKGKFKV